jgi:zinc protease
VQATAFVAHPYQFPVIGWPSDIESWTQDDLLNYYRTYYAPNNRAIVITGDVTPGEIFDLADEYFTKTPAQPSPPPIRTVEPEQQGARRVVVEAPAQTPLLHMAFHASSASDPDSLPLRLLFNVLTGGDSSRLHRLLVEDEGLALAVDGYQDKGFDPGLAYFYLTLPPGGDTAAVERRVLEELQRLARNGVSDAELAKARNIILADFWRGLATINGKASILGQYEVFHGNYEKLFDLPEALQAITADDLRTVAAKLFRVNNMTVGVLRAASEGGAP